ncbi:MAG: hypothetical protein HYT75_03590 [Deltaproteobacteria bacterium]|nr:hypothetical protein [Deltaproteobacteria bacterium]MBI2341726.1 hypothetical protein [Deltaproteobacteria bacterium]
MIRRLITLSLLVVAGCGGGSSAPTSPAQVPTSVEYATIEGQVMVGSADLNLASPISKSLASKATPNASITTLADTPLPNATVDLYKISADGTEEIVAGKSTTTDANGNYTITDFTPAVPGTGALTDFYYEIRATSGDVEVIAAAAPTEDATVNLTPETKVAAIMLNDVLNGAQTIPQKSIIDQLNTVVSYSLYNYGDTVTQPSTIATAETNLLYIGTGLANDSGNAEFAARAVEADKTYLGISSSTASAYLEEKVIRRGCLYDADLIVSSDAINGAFADALISGTTVTPDQIITAYNNNSSSTATASATADAFGNILTAIENAFTQGTALATSNVIGVYSQRDLSAVATDTALEIDQGLSFLESVVGCGGSGVDWIGFTNELLGTSLAYNSSAEKAGESTAGNYIVDENLYPSSTAICQEGGTLGGIVILEMNAGVSITSVIITGNGDPLTLIYDNEHAYRINPNDASAARCIGFGTEKEITVTANFSDGSSDVITKTITSLDVPEPTISSVDRCDTELGMLLSESELDPTCVSVSRPVFQWVPSPGAENVPTDAPSGSKLMYVFDVTSPCSSYQVTSPVDKSFMLSPIECDPAACGETTGTCRLFMRAEVYDANGRIISAGPAAFAYVCVEGQPDCASSDDW